MGSVFHIKWQSNAIPPTDFVSIRLYLGAVSSATYMQAITNLTPNSGDYPWLVETPPLYASDLPYIIRVTWLKSEDVTGYSDGTFLLSTFNLTAKA